VDPKEQNSVKQETTRHIIKKCPECYTYLPLRAKVCPACQAKVGDVDKLGFAGKPFDWQGYLGAGISIVAFVIFIWWAFVRE